MSSPKGTDGLAKLSTRSGAWLFGRRISTSLIRLGATAILARHLSPADFGIVALAQVVLGFITFSQDTGVGTYVVYDREKNWEERIRSAFWLNNLLAVALIAIVMAVLPVVSSFYQHPELQSVAAVLAAIFFLRQLQAIPENLLRRRLEYRALVIRDTLCDFLSAGLSVVLALTGWGLWSLVLPSLFVEPIRLITIFSVTKWWPKLHLGTGDWGKIIRYSFPLMGTNMISLIMNDGDTLLIGKALGSHVLGIYNLAWQLSNIMGKNIVSIVGNIGMSSLAALENNLERLRNAYLRILRLLAVITFPILSIMFVVADDLIQVIYGPRWSEAVVLLRVFIVFTIIRSMTSLTGTIFNITGRTDTSMKISLWYLPPYLAAIFFGAKWGVLGVASGVVMVRSICALHSLVLSSRSIQLPLRLLAQSTLLTAIIASIMAVLVWLTQTGLENIGTPLLVRLLVSSGVGLLLSFVGILLYDRRAYAELVTMTSSLVPRLGRNLAVLQR